MAKIEREKSVRAVVGSACLEGYKGSHKVTPAKKAGSLWKEMKPKATAKR